MQATCSPIAAQASSAQAAPRRSAVAVSASMAPRPSYSARRQRQARCERDYGSRWVANKLELEPFARLPRPRCQRRRCYNGGAAADATLSHTC
jgi:hypothetical protein